MKKIVILIVVVTLLVAISTVYMLGKNKKEQQDQVVPGFVSGEIGEELSGEKESGDEIKEEIDDSIGKVDNNLSDFDLSFLKMENKKENIIYSPLSIKYALKMLEEGANGESKNQISKLIGDYTLTKYVSNKNMSLANGVFVKNSFKENVKQSYINLLKSKYDAEVKFDSFADAKNINEWIKDKTLGIIPQMMQDSDVASLEFALINALAIDMEWNEKFLPKLAGEGYQTYIHEKFDWAYPEFVSSNSFENMKDEISGMQLETVINNYDIVKELGEDNIRKTVGDAYTEFLYDDKELDLYATVDYAINEVLGGERTEETVKKAVNEYLDGYIEEINSNYGRLDTYHHFALADNENEKVFVKDLKEYDGTTLQYVGIMPKNGTLTDYINSKNANELNEIINTAKELKNENFKQGVITEIIGHIPKFKFEYNLDLMNDLKTSGITDVFESEKADITNLTSTEGAYISDAKHKANIEFTQDGIKAAAVTEFGGAGAGDWFNYLYDVPVEKIDMTFDRPYLFLIRDKNNGETWFIGTVYEPLKWEDDVTRNGKGTDAMLW